MTQAEAETIVDLIEKRVVIDTSTLDNMTTMDDLIKWLRDDSRTSLEYYLGWIQAARLMTNPNGTCNHVLSAQFSSSGLGGRIVEVINQARKMATSKRS